MAQQFLHCPRNPTQHLLQLRHIRSRSCSLAGSAYWYFYVFPFSVRKGNPNRARAGPMEGFNVGIAGTEGFQVLCKLFWNDSTILVATTLPLPNCTSEKKKILTTNIDHGDRPIRPHTCVTKRTSNPPLLPLYLL